MTFRLVPKSVTLNDLERRNGRYFAVFQRIRVASWAHCVKTFAFAISFPDEFLQVHAECSLMCTDGTVLYSMHFTVHRYVFTARRNARIASAVLAIPIPSVRQSVCPSVRPSHAGIVSKRLHVERCSLHCQIAKCV